jgi:hypothetical protein
MRTVNSKQESLFKEDQRRTRNVEKYVRAKSKDGSLSIRLDPVLAKKVRKYCRLKQLNCKKLIEKIIREKIDELISSQFDGMTREDMAEVILRLQAEKEAEA